MTTIPGSENSRPGRVAPLDLHRAPPRTGGPSLRSAPRHRPPPRARRARRAERSRRPPGPAPALAPHRATAGDWGPLRRDHATRRPGPCRTTSHPPCSSPSERPRRRSRSPSRCRCSASRPCSSCRSCRCRPASSRRPSSAPSPTTPCCGAAPGARAAGAAPPVTATTCPFGGAAGAWAAPDEPVAVEDWHADLARDARLEVDRRLRPAASTASWPASTTTACCANRPATSRQSTSSPPWRRSGSWGRWGSPPRRRSTACACRPGHWRRAARRRTGWSTSSTGGSREVAAGDLDVVARGTGRSLPTVEAGVVFVRRRLRPFVLLPEVGPRAGPVDVVLSRLAGPAGASLPGPGLEVHVPDAATLGLSLDRGLAGLGPDARAWLAPHHTAAVHLLAAVDARAWMLTRVAEVLVRRQGAFVADGPAAHRPLRRAEVAHELGVHPSTVGRAVAGKVARCPDGRVVPLEEFFGATTSTRERVREALERAARGQRRARRGAPGGVGRGRRAADRREVPRPGALRLLTPAEPARPARSAPVSARTTRTDRARPRRPDRRAPVRSTLRRAANVPTSSAKRSSAPTPPSRPRRAGRGLARNLQGRRREPPDREGHTLYARHRPCHVRARAGGRFELLRRGHEQPGVGEAQEFESFEAGPRRRPTRWSWRVSLLEVSGEEELDQFLGTLVRSAASAARGFAGLGPGRALGGILKNAARQVLPQVGGSSARDRRGPRRKLGQRAGQWLGGQFEFEGCRRRTASSRSPAPSCGPAADAARIADGRRPCRRPGKRPVAAVVGAASPPARPRPAPSGRLRPPGGADGGPVGPPRAAASSSYARDRQRPPTQSNPKGEAMSMLETVRSSSNEGP